MPDRIPAEVFPPGEIIGDEMIERGWDETDLAQRLRISANEASEILAGTREITRPIATKLEETFDVAAGFWLALDESYRRHMRRYPCGNRPDPG